MFIILEKVINNSKQKLISKPQQKLRSQKHNSFTEEVNKFSLSANDNKRIQSIDSTEHMHIEQIKK